MTPDKDPFSHPATKVARCMAVTGSLPGVNPSHVGAWCDRDELPTYACSCHVSVLAIAEFRKDFPLLADRLDSMRAAAMVRGGGVAGSLRDGGDGGAEFSGHPDGNNGDNLTHRTDKGVL